MKRFMFTVIMASVLIFMGCTSQTSHLVHAQEVIFTTAEKAPKQFKNWTFFWRMPEMEPDAALEYVVIQPDGKEYFRMKVKRLPQGTSVRSDFSLSFNKRDPSVFYNQHITVKFRVSKGQLKFDLSAVKFRFESFAKEIDAVPK